MILGVWDGHDAGACIVEDGRIKVAINEERLTRRKLDIGFPVNAIAACLRYMNLNPEDVEHIACCSSQFSRVMARAIPRLDKNFYEFRRRLKPRPRFERRRRLIKYRMTEIGSNELLKKITKRQLAKSWTSWVSGITNFILLTIMLHTLLLLRSALGSARLFA